MRIAVFLNQLGLGGTEKAAARWARGLHERGHELHLLALHDGPRRGEFERHNIEVRIVGPDVPAIRKQLQSFRPDVIHAHAPGHPHEGDILGEVLSTIPKIPVLQTNIFGQLQNPKEDMWTDFRLFVSWTSCVQAARRYFRSLDHEFFRRASVAVNPLDPIEDPPRAEVKAFRSRLGIGCDEILFGRLSRPEPNKWTDLAIEAFRRAARQHHGIKLLLREPPAAVAQTLYGAADRDRFVLLPATDDEAELRLTMAGLDAVLHTSLIGESFGYGIAESMNLGKPVIVNSTPWGDQAQLELVRPGQCGFIASNPAKMAEKILRLAEENNLRARLGAAGRDHIRTLAEPRTSIDRLERALETTAAGMENPRIGEDLRLAREAASYLDREQFGHTWVDQVSLRPAYYRARFHQLRQAIQIRFHSEYGH